MGNQLGQDYHKPTSNTIKIVLSGDGESKRVAFLLTYQMEKPLRDEEIPSDHCEFKKTIKFHNHKLHLILHDSESGYESWYPMDRKDNEMKPSINVLFFSLISRESFNSALKKYVEQIWSQNEAPIIFVGSHKQDRDKDPENSNYISGKEAMDASEYFRVLYHELDHTDVEGIKHFFESTVPEVV